MLLTFEKISIIQRRGVPRLYNLSQHHFHKVPQIHTGDGGAKGFENFQYGGVGYLCVGVLQARHPINP